MRNHKSRALRLESLEERALLAATVLDNGTLEITGTRGDDHIYVSDQSGQIRVIDNGETSFFTASKIVIDCKSGDDYVEVSGNITLPTWIAGGKGNDTLKGGTGDDVITGGADNDTIFGNLGQDQIFGDAGNDFLDAGDRGIASGGNTVVGGTGDDIIYGGDAHDLLFGMAGDDEIHGADTDDYCDGGSGNDHIEGDGGLDEILGGAGDDFLSGGDQDDYIDGGKGTDQCWGGLGDDKLKGGAGDDLLDGQGDNNLLFSDKGHDTLANGIATNLDNEVTAVWHGSGIVECAAEYTLSNDNGTLKRSLRVYSIYALSTGFHDIMIDGQAIGQLETSIGLGSITFSSNPTGTDHPLAPNFPEIHPGLKVQVGALQLSKFEPTRQISIDVPKAPKP